MDTIIGLADLDRAASIQDVAKAAAAVTWNENIMAADDKGNIGWWHPGRLPLRPKRWDERLPYPGTGNAESGRQLEIFLDAVAMYASDDHSWLLDPRFVSLLPADERSLAERVRALADEVEQASAEGNAWSALATQLHGFPKVHLLIRSGAINPLI